MCNKHDTEQVAFECYLRAKERAERLLACVPAAKGLLVQVARANGYVGLWCEGAKVLSRQGREAVANGLSSEAAAAVDAAVQAYVARAEFARRYGKE